MYKISCREMAGSNCDFTVEGETKEEVKNKYYAHGAEADVHRQMYNSATDEQKAEFNKKLDEYLDKQDK